MAQFAVVFSALIHDVDHRGVPNSALAKEDEDMVHQYHGKALAEQNSVDIAWKLLMSPDFQDLRASIYTTPDEFRRFRLLVVNTVMATDLLDVASAAVRKNRWSRAFENEETAESRSMDDVSRKATIVTEHLIQASDVAHTMQHWVSLSKQCSVPGSLDSCHDATAFISSDFRLTFLFLSFLYSACLPKME